MRRRYNCYRADKAAEDHVSGTGGAVRARDEPTGARPAIGAAEDRARTMGVASPGPDSVWRVQGPSARSQDTATNSSRPRRSLGFNPVIQPTAPHHRMRDTRLVAGRGAEILRDGVRVRVVRMRARTATRPSCQRAANVPEWALCDRHSVGARSSVMRWALLPSLALWLVAAAILALVSWPAKACP